MYGSVLRASSLQPCTHFGAQMDVPSPNCSKYGDLSTSPPTKGRDLSVSPETRHYALLNTNEPPEDSDLPLIHSVISEADARLACLNDEISRLLEKLKPLEDERASLLSYRTQNKSVLSPLRRMPSEVLGEIFLWTLPSLQDAIITGRFDMGRSPWLLTRISSRWRAVSLSTPSL